MRQICSCSGNMKLNIGLVCAVIALGSATLLTQDQPQLTPRTAPKLQASAQVGPTAVTPAAPAARAQSAPQLTVAPAAASSENSSAPEFVTVPAGTRIPLTLKQGITTKNAHVGDPVYAQTAFPITQNDKSLFRRGLSSKAQF